MWGGGWGVWGVVVVVVVVVVVWVWVGGGVGGEGGREREDCEEKVRVMVVRGEEEKKELREKMIEEAKGCILS